ncbi:unnamed protein product [Calypogeia fissa]
MQQTRENRRPRRVTPHLVLQSQSRSSRQRFLLPSRPSPDRLERYRPEMAPATCSLDGMTFLSSLPRPSCALAGSLAPRVPEHLAPYSRSLGPGSCGSQYIVTHTSVDFAVPSISNRALMTDWTDGDGERGQGTTGQNRTDQGRLGHGTAPLHDGTAGWSTARGDAAEGSHNDDSGARWSTNETEEAEK